MKDIRIVFTGGGTGGHIFPLLAVAQEIKRVTADHSDVRLLLYYMGAPGIYGNILSDAGLRIVSLITFKMRRYFSPLNVLDVIKFPFALVQAFFKMLFLMPNVVFSKGGSGALPVVFVAWLFRIPVFVHDSDSIPGATNSWSFGVARRIALSFNKALEFSPKQKSAVVGNPIRPSFFALDSDMTQEKAKRLFGFEPSLPLILVLGGSQGSTRVNDFMLDSVDSFVKKYQVLHQTGVEHFLKVKNELAVITKNFVPAERSRYKIVDFLQKELLEALLASDVVVSRAGSGAIFEIAALSKPSILIPLPESAHDHQRFNAYEYAKAGACVVMEEDNLSSALFFSQLNGLVDDQSRYQQMAQSARAFSKPDAARLIAQELLRLV